MAPARCEVDLRGAKSVVPPDALAAGSVAPPTGVAPVAAPSDVGD
ncbi:MAG: hypothetical protein QOH17_1018 [Pseudonocardiales bacterium]|nr:hypothetical protein [Pseudonocardiales bacterium]